MVDTRIDLPERPAVGVKHMNEGSIPGSLAGVRLVRGCAQGGWVLIIGAPLLRIDHSSVLSASLTLL
jgi:hypothetical protein